MRTNITISDSIVIGNEFPICIIAEAGVNHNGDLGMALKLVEEAKKAGANCVKFQTFKAERIVTHTAPKAEYQKLTTDGKESQFEMLKKLELTFDDYAAIVAKCRQENILFLSTPYSEEDVDFLETLEVAAYKIASGQIIELPFLRSIARTRKPILLSTGMSTIGEIDRALRAIREEGNDRIILLQCTSNYPSRISDANLQVIPSLRETFHVHCGYSDHTQGSTACLVAVAFGVRVIEKHFTLDKNLPGPDHSSSADTAEFACLAAGIREAEKSLGASMKQPAEAETINAVGMRRSICAKQPIAEGTLISADMLTFKRPSTGIHPYYFDLVVGKKAKRAISSDRLMSWEDLC
jgi:N,N'-diacetyllegionaminate synthase